MLSPYLDIYFYYVNFFQKLLALTLPDLTGLDAYRL